MAISYYDEAVTQKIKGWLADSSKLRVLSPDESTRLIQMHAEDSGDKPLQLPLIAISRNKDIEIGNAIKQNKSFDGLILDRDKDNRTTVHLNVIPVKTTYQLDIYTRYLDEADEYARNFIFNIINYPKLNVEIPYEDQGIRHDANIRIISDVDDNSDIPERLISGQFTRLTLGLNIDDAYLFDVRIRDIVSIKAVDILAANE